MKSIETTSTRIAAVTKEEWKPFVERAIRVSGFTDEDGQIIKEAAPHLRPKLDEISNLLYESMLNYEPVATLIEAKDEGVAFRTKLKAWLGALLSGKYGDKFWSWQWVFGLILLKNKVDTAYFSIAHSRLSVIIIKTIFEVFSEDSGRRVATAYLNAMSGVSSVICKSYQREYQAAIADAGLNAAIINRVIKLSVDNKIKNIIK